jgi:hypothetical protein
VSAANESQGAEERLRLARELLIEAHHRARAQSGDLGPPQTEPEAADPDFSRQGREILGVLYPQPMAPTRRERVLSVVRRYVDRAEALDRRRVRFVHDFRASHGFDRSAYTPAEAAELAGGLERLDAEAGDGLRAAALELVDPPSDP